MNKTLLALWLVLATSPALAIEPSFDVPPNVELQTGDSWSFKGKTYRLYGVQSCLRGTNAITADLKAVDCGNVSLARLGAMIALGTVSCQPVGIANDKAIFTVCAAKVSGKTIDVGTALIASGYAFAALFPDGKPVNMEYRVAEQTAQNNRNGLWANQFEHPNAILVKGR